MSITEYHILFISHVWFYLKSPGYPASGSIPLGNFRGGLLSWSQAGPVIFWSHPQVLCCLYLNVSVDRAKFGFGHWRLV